MKLWVPVAAASLLLVSYLFYYALGATEGQGTASVGLANAAGLAAVIIGVAAAALIIRRGHPPADTSNARNH